MIGGQTNIWAIVLQLGISFAFLVAMFALARWGGKHVGRGCSARATTSCSRSCSSGSLWRSAASATCSEFGCDRRVPDRPGLGATRFRSRIEGFALPLRDVFGAFFF